MLVRLLFIWVFLLSAQVLASAEGMYIHTDGLGSPVARTNQQGQVISRTRYEPYGATAAGATPKIGFTGHVNDPATQLIYMQQRYYDPYAGRFLSTDPILTDANTGGGFNRYTYANNNPFKYIDPDGRKPDDAYCLTGGGCYSDGSGNGSKDSRDHTGSLNPYAATGFVLGGIGGGMLAGGCDFYTLGTCALANPAMVAGGATGGALMGAEIGVRIERAWKQLDNLLTTAIAGTGGPTEYQYALLAQVSGPYPNVRGGLTTLQAGDVWKYGTTLDPGGRYSQAALDGLNLRMVTQASGSGPQVLVAEKIQLIQYATFNRHLPPGNRVFK